MSQRETVLRVRLLPDGRLEYEDWRGKTETCRAADLGEKARAILVDPNLPPVRVVNPGATKVAEFYARALLPPELRHLAGPGVTALEDVLRAVQRARQRVPAAAPPQGNAEPAPPPDPPRPSAHRRGKRVA